MHQKAHMVAYASGTPHSLLVRVPQHLWVQFLFHGKWSALLLDLMKEWVCPSPEGSVDGGWNWTGEIDPFGSSCSFTVSRSAKHPTCRGALHLRN